MNDRLEEVTLQLNPGDWILLYTDGVTETMDHAQDPFGEQRLEAALRDAAHCAPEEITEHLRQAITYRTVSVEPGKPWDEAPFAAFLEFLAQTYPAVHAGTELTLIASFTPLYRWAGSDPSLKPVLLTAHYDVVPAKVAEEIRAGFKIVDEE